MTIDYTAGPTLLHHLLLPRNLRKTQRKAKLLVELASVERYPSLWIAI
jgi:hypothetical protein